MVLTRIWFFALSAVCAVLLSAALMGTAAINRINDREVTQALGRDRLELEMMLKTDARVRLDALAPVAAHSEVRSILSESSRSADGTSLDNRRKLETRLQTLNRQMQAMGANLLIAIDRKGRIAGQLGGTPPPAGANLGKFPLAEKALAGYIRDDVWVYNGRIYRMAARPTIDRGEYVGAILHGKEVDGELARRLGERLDGATVLFFERDRAIATHVPQAADAAQPDQILSNLATALSDEKLNEGKRTDPMDLGDAARGVFSLVTGSAGRGQVGYAIARPRAVLASPFAIFDQITSDDADKVTSESMPIVVGSALLVFGIAMLLLWLEKDRPFGRLKAAAEALGKRELDRFDISNFGASYRLIAQSVNEALDKVTAQAAPNAAAARGQANLDDILGPAPEPGSAPAFFGFAENNAAGGAPAAAAPKPAPAPRPAPAAPPVAAPPVAAPPAAAPPAAAPPAPAGEKAWAKGTMVGLGNGGAAAGSGPVQAPVAAPPPPVAPPASVSEAPMLDDDEDDDEDGATMVAAVPEELLANLGGQQTEEEKHFKQVFDEFVQMKKQCGEPTAGLTLEKFSTTLRKNRDQIVSRHGAAGVRFTVYEKDGKAALKATPVKA